MYFKFANVNKLKKSLTFDIYFNALINLVANSLNFNFNYMF